MEDMEENEVLEGELLPAEREETPEEKAEKDRRRPFRVLMARRYYTEEEAKADNRCGAKCKNRSYYCPNMPVGGSGRCRVHGGMSPSGTASARYAGKGTSSKLPTRLLDKYKESLEDPDILALTNEIALLDSRIDDLLSRVDAGEGGQAWKHLQAQIRKLNNARSRGDTGAMSEALDAIEDLHVSTLEGGTGGLSDWLSWEEISKLIDQRRKLVDSERARRKDMASVLTIEQSILFITDTNVALKEELERQIGKCRNLSEKEQKELIRAILTGVAIRQEAFLNRAEQANVAGGVRLIQ